MVASGLVLVDGARFVVDPTIGSARLSIAWQTLNICLRVAEDIEADYGVAAVQLSHIKLYQKIYNFTQIADPRDYCQLNTKLALIGVDLRNSAGGAGAQGLRSPALPDRPGCSRALIEGSKSWRRYPRTGSCWRWRRRGTPLACRWC
jgi:hypothetical protein